MYKFGKKLILKKYWSRHKSFLQFVGVFLLTYVGITLLYQWYLEGYGSKQVDGITQMVARHTQYVLHAMENNSSIYWSDSMGIVVRILKKDTVRIIEGCNAVSVIILFVSFVIAFAGKFSFTLFYVISGSALLYVLNVFRIAALSLLLYYFPEHTHLLHGVLFPLVIYGVVFLLWIVWISIFSKYAKASGSK